MPVRSLPLTSIMSSSFSAPCSIPLLIAQLESSSSHSPSSARHCPPANSRRISNIPRGGLAAPPSTPVEACFGRCPSAVEGSQVVVPASEGSHSTSPAEDSLRASLVRSSCPSCASPTLPPAPLPASSVQVYTLPGFVPSAYVLRSSVRKPLIVRLRENSVTVELTVTDERGAHVPLPQARLIRKVSTVWSRFGDVDFSGESSATLLSSV